MGQAAEGRPNLPASLPLIGIPRLLTRTPTGIPNRRRAIGTTSVCQQTSPCRIGCQKVVSSGRQSLSWTPETEFRCVMGVLSDRTGRLEEVVEQSSYRDVCFYARIQSQVWWFCCRLGSSFLTISTAALLATKSSSSSLTVLSFSLTVAVPSRPTMCRAGGLSWPPIAATA